MIVICYNLCAFLAVIYCTKIILLKRYLFLLPFLFIYLSGYAQSDSISLKDLAQKAVTVSVSHPVEKVYLHFDKPYYAVGDTIWFKAYLTMDIHAPSVISKVLNVEIINERDSLIQNMKLPVTDGVASGNIALPGETYKQGNYRIRAYTAWMLNFPMSYMFERTFAVGSALNKELSTQIAYTGNINDKNSPLNARILYKALDGTVLANKRVDWQLNRNGDLINKGHGVTDAYGYLTVPVSAAKKEDILTGALITSIEIADKRNAGSVFVLKNAFNGSDFQLFPEGGTLVADVPNTVAFKAIQTNGLGIAVKGSVTDGQGKEIVSFASQHLGMGKFIFTPQPNVTYKANAEFADGSKTVYQLPRVTANGITISANNTNPAALVLQISASQSYFEKHKGQSYYVVARMGNFVAYAGQAALTAPTYSAALSKSKFRTGVLQVTLFSSAGDPLSERLVFIDHEDPLNIAVSGDKQSYFQRGKVALKLSAKAADLPTEGNFSVAVIDETKTPFDDNNLPTIQSHLLLASDITGYVEQPNYYFNHSDAKKKGELDLLLMTQGFRQFSFFDIVDNKVPPVTILAEQGINLSGNLRKLNGIPVFKGSLRIIIPDKNFSTEAMSDADGNFSFKNVAFTDSSKITVNARNNTDAKNLKVTMSDGYYAAINKSVNAADELLNIDSTLNPYIKNSEKQYQFNRILKEVVIKSTNIKHIDHTAYSQLNGLPNQPDHLVPGSVFKGCTNLYICITSSLLGVLFRDNNFYVVRDYNQGNKNPMQVYVKGLPVDVGYLANVDVNMVESVETFFKDGFSGINQMNNTNGIISVNMKESPKGTKMSAKDLALLFPEQNVITFSPKGYEKVRQFYSPKYDVIKSAQNADLRTTIYWNPVVTTDKLGNAILNYYNADGRGTYKAIIEGFDKDGNLGRTVYRYTVK